MERLDVVVIGAGPAGLSCASELRRQGLHPTVLEQADTVGPEWRGRYDRLRLNTSRWVSHLPGSKYPRGTSMFPARDVVVRHLEDHARRHQLDVRTGVRVERLDPDGGGWRVHTASGDLWARDVVIATGFFRKPWRPDWPGLERFQGTLMHASAYRNGAAFAGRSVVVVGAGSSGMEIAYDLAESGVPAVYLSVRTPPSILLRKVGPFPGDPLAMLLLRLPPAWADGFVRFMRRRVMGDLPKYGLPPPEDGPFKRLHRDWVAPAIIDEEVLDAIRAGRIRVVAAVESFDARGVRLADGGRLDVDAVVAATGYRCNLDGLVGHLGVLDEKGRPRMGSGEEVVPGLRFVGFRPVPAAFRAAGRQAHRMARDIARARRRARRAPAPEIRQAAAGAKGAPGLAAVPPERATKQQPRHGASPPASREARG